MKKIFGAVCGIVSMVFVFVACSQGLTSAPEHKLGAVGAVNPGGDPFGPENVFTPAYVDPANVSGCALDTAQCGTQYTCSLNAAGQPMGPCQSVKQVFKNWGGGSQPTISKTSKITCLSAGTEILPVLPLITTGLPGDLAVNAYDGSATLSCYTTNFVGQKQVCDGGACGAF